MIFEYNWMTLVIRFTILLCIQPCAFMFLAPAIAIIQHHLINGGNCRIYQEPALLAYHGWTLSANRTQYSINRQSKTEKTRVQQHYHVLQICLLILLTVGEGRLKKTEVLFVVGQWQHIAIMWANSVWYTAQTCFTFIRLSVGSCKV